MLKQMMMALPGLYRGAPFFVCRFAGLPVFRFVSKKIPVFDPGIW
jgi:hypothetical protein